MKVWVVPLASGESSGLAKEARAKNGGGPRVVIEVAQPLIERARQAGYTLLPESDGFELLEQLGLPTPISTRFLDPQDLEAEALEQFPGERVVLKADCADLAHKTEVGGVRVLPRKLQEIRAAASQMALELTERHHRGFLLQEYVDAPSRLGEELLLSLCWDREFGPVVTLGTGGTQSEILARHLAPEAAV